MFFDDIKLPNQLQEGYDSSHFLLDENLNVVGMSQMPLLFDVAFGGMAVTIIFGLTFATGLTLFVTPALYSMFYKVKGK